ncbi:MULTISPECIES: hydrogenase maturation nickel metallochaperone HypA [Paraburkholderia]|uniref:Hydrogenase maturation factor HypA n=2 Tax=Paraburkholderia TaxID=1822464 RepID=A0A248VYE4_9BURK|nr:MULTISPECIES: hydrogenase maturation nickel metallochaperone HypA [Paraburkholderia]ASW04028.1 hydrogenase maturation nickel metallochaperone HypA [Paraburkholderia aromaticivorans]CAB3738542.1 Hydrogenase maturation factor HybF [Paraburkholderia phenoliruptrix]
MHEVGLAGGILRVVEQTAERERFRLVVQLRLEAGRFCAVDVRALRFALEAIAPGTLLEGAEILIDEAPGRAWCWTCEIEVALMQRGDSCPNCGGYRLQARAGTELRVIDMRVED